MMVVKNYYDDHDYHDYHDYHGDHNYHDYHDGCEIYHDGCEKWSWWLWKTIMMIVIKLPQSPFQGWWALGRTIRQTAEIIMSAKIDFPFLVYWRKEGSIKSTLVTENHKSRAWNCPTQAELGSENRFQHIYWQIWGFCKVKGLECWRPENWFREKRIQHTLEG